MAESEVRIIRSSTECGSVVIRKMVPKPAGAHMERQWTVSMIQCDIKLIIHYHTLFEKHVKCI